MDAVSQTVIDTEIMLSGMPQSIVQHLDNPHLPPLSSVRWIYMSTVLQPGFSIFYHRLLVNCSANP